MRRSEPMPEPARGAFPVAFPCFLTSAAVHLILVLSLTVAVLAGSGSATAPPAAVAIDPAPPFAPEAASEIREPPEPEVPAAGETRTEIVPPEAPEPDRIDALAPPPELAPPPPAAAPAPDPRETARAPAVARPREHASFREAIEEVKGRGLDLVLVIDSTGSMSGPIAAARREALSLIDFLEAIEPRCRLGIVAYRDRGADEEYLLRTFPLSSDRTAAMEFLKRVEANGGGDGPEAVDAGLEAATRMMPFASRAVKIVILIGDEPPHPADEERTVRLAAAFRASGGIVSTIDTRTGAGGSAFRAIAGAGGGDAVALGEGSAIARTLALLVFGTGWREEVERLWDRAVLDPPKTAGAYNPGP